MGSDEISEGGAGFDEIGFGFIALLPSQAIAL
jgi:hypothetical protein